ncbi:RIB43A-like with coiled-coils protein 2 [Latimeria chalumnae]|uniref:RIB43A-like with coiled-coils protein 2 n=1 Tax=Latimeria chalumnae TaxID=7897 RepID=UPI00313BFDE3
MYKVNLPQDLREAAVIERRRNRELQRQSRIFNAKVRTIGLDIETLDKQVEDRKRQEELEKAREDAYDADRIRHDKIVAMLDQRQAQDCLKLNQALVDFRERHQQPESRREFDLNDPQALKKDKPARVSDDDPRLGPSSLQKLDGEDLNNKARTKYQVQQAKKWLIEQMNDRNRAKADQEFADDLHFKKCMELEERAVQLCNLEQECRKAVCIATGEFNKALAAETAERQRLETQQDNDDNFSEIHNNLTGDFLTENPAVASSAFGPHRVIPDRWKGMSPGQLEEIRKIQEKQRQENEILREQERQRQAEWDKQLMLTDRAGMILNREAERMAARCRQEQDEYNRQLAQEHKAQKEYLEKNVFTNIPTAHYYTQFNTTSR